MRRRRVDRIADPRRAWTRALVQSPCQGCIRRASRPRNRVGCSLAITQMHPASASAIGVCSISSSTSATSPGPYLPVLSMSAPRSTRVISLPPCVCSGHAGAGRRLDQLQAPSTANLQRAMPQPRSDPAPANFVEAAADQLGKRCRNFACRSRDAALPASCDHLRHGRLRAIQGRRRAEPTRARRRCVPASSAHAGNAGTPRRGQRRPQPAHWAASRQRSSSRSHRRGGA